MTHVLIFVCLGYLRCDLAKLFGSSRSIPFAAELLYFDSRNLFAQCTMSYMYILSNNDLFGKRSRLRRFLLSFCFPWSEFASISQPRTAVEKAQ
jgi:hypothetical protein